MAGYSGGSDAGFGSGFASSVMESQQQQMERASQIAQQVWQQHSMGLQDQMAQLDQQKFDWTKQQADTAQAQADKDREDAKEAADLQAKQIQAHINAIDQQTRSQQAQNFLAYYNQGMPLAAAMKLSGVDAETVQPFVQQEVSRSNKQTTQQFQGQPQGTAAMQSPQTGLPQQPQMQMQSGLGPMLMQQPSGGPNMAAVPVAEGQPAAGGPPPFAAAAMPQAQMGFGPPRGAMVPAQSTAPGPTPGQQAMALPPPTLPPSMAQTPETIQSPAFLQAQAAQAQATRLANIQEQQERLRSAGMALQNKGMAAKEASDELQYGVYAKGVKAMEQVQALEPQYKQALIDSIKAQTALSDAQRQNVGKEADAATRAETAKNLGTLRDSYFTMVDAAGKAGAGVEKAQLDLDKFNIHVKKQKDVVNQAAAAYDKTPNDQTKAALIRAQGDLQSDQAVQDDLYRKLRGAKVVQGNYQGIADNMWKVYSAKDPEMAKLYKAPKPPPGTTQPVTPANTRPVTSAVYTLRGNGQVADPATMQRFLDAYGGNAAAAKKALTDQGWKIGK